MTESFFNFALFLAFNSCQNLLLCHWSGGVSECAIIKVLVPSKESGRVKLICFPGLRLCVVEPLIA